MLGSDLLACLQETKLILCLSFPASISRLCTYSHIALCNSVIDMPCFNCFYWLYHYESHSMWVTRAGERAYPLLRSHIEGHRRETGLDLCSPETDRCGVLADPPLHIRQRYTNMQAGTRLQKCSYVMQCPYHGTFHHQCCETHEYVHTSNV